MTNDERARLAFCTVTCGLVLFVWAISGVLNAIHVLMN